MDILPPYSPFLNSIKECSTKSSQKHIKNKIIADRIEVSHQMLWRLDLSLAKTLANVSQHGKNIDILCRSVNFFFTFCKIILGLPLNRLFKPLSLGKNPVYEHSWNKGF